MAVIRKMAPVNLIVYYPKTEKGKKELARHVSDVHAAAVTQRLKSLNCPTRQKLDLLDAVIKTVKERSRESCPVSCGARPEADRKNTMPHEQKPELIDAAANSIKARKKSGKA